MHITTTTMVVREWRPDKAKSKYCSNMYEVTTIIALYLEAKKVSLNKNGKRWWQAGRRRRRNPHINYAQQVTQTRKHRKHPVAMATAIDKPRAHKGKCWESNDNCIERFHVDSFFFITALSNRFIHMQVLVIVSTKSDIFYGVKSRDNEYIILYITFLITVLALIIHIFLIYPGIMACLIFWKRNAYEYAGTSPLLTRKRKTNVTVIYEGIHIHFGNCLKILIR